MKKTVVLALIAFGAGAILPFYLYDRWMEHMEHPYAWDPDLETWDDEDDWDDAELKEDEQSEMSSGKKSVEEIEEILKEPAKLLHEIYDIRERCSRMGK